jgi:DNA-binding NarL/FixJ family response regulator
MSIRVIIADDHNVVRKGIRDLLSDEDDIVVVGEARNGHEAVDLRSSQMSW